jgi:hypothetical protein
VDEIPDQVGDDGKNGNLSTKTRQIGGWVGDFVFK